MNGELAPLLTILGLMVVAFLHGRLPVDLVALCGLFALFTANLVTVQEAFSGFSSPAVITMVATFLLSGAIRETGVADFCARNASRLCGRSDYRVCLAVVGLAVFFSAFMNNVVAATLLLPTVMRMSEENEIPLSKLLIPLAFGSILGGMTTLIGTPPNIVAGEILRQRGYAPFELLDFTPIGLATAVVCGLVLISVSLKYLPKGGIEQGRRANDDLKGVYGLAAGILSVKIPDSSDLIGKTLGAINFSQTYGCRITEIHRAGRIISAPNSNDIILAGDKLLIVGHDLSLEQLREEMAVENHRSDSNRVEPSRKVSSLSELVVESEIAQSDLESDEVGLLEVVLSPRSKLVGKSIRELNFRAKYGFLVLAVWRGGKSIRENIGDLVLQHGDALLLQGARGRMPHMARNPDFVLLSRIVPAAARGNKAIWVGLALLGMMAFSAFGILPVEVSAMAASVLVVALGAISLDEGYRDIEWRIVFFTAALIPFGIAVERVGLSDIVSRYFLDNFNGGGPLLALLALALLTSILSQVLDGVPAVVMMGPVAIEVAKALDASVYPFMMVVALSASVAFLTPFSHKVNLLVMGAGGYSAKDYFRVGLPITIVSLVIILTVVPLVFPL